MQAVKLNYLPRQWWEWVWCLLVLVMPVSAQATHIIGGDMSMRAVGSTPGLFRVQLNQYWDETKTGTGNRDQTVRLLIYRKQNPILVETLILNLQEALPLVFDNEACAKQRKLNFTEARYYKTYQFDPSRYTDPGGYYIVWERCCRNDELTNAISIGNAGVAMVFYMEFPPMQKNGTSFVNSSPSFGVPNGDYICLNKPFTFNVKATDADGDELRYSLVTPLNGYTTRTSPLSTDDSPKATYPTITWAQGISLQNAIPGNPSLNINPTTGQLSVQASQEGLFLFTVQCEEFRNGQRIGVIRRDFQLSVVDCSKSTPPPAVIMVNNQPTQSINWCSSQPLVLSVEKNPLWAYQWQKDGENLRGDTTSSLNIKEPGVYTVVRSQAKTCSNDTTSEATRVIQQKAAPVKLSTLEKQPYCTGDTLTLRAEGQPGYQYRWRRDGQDISGQQQATLRVSQSGQYTVFAVLPTVTCEGADSLKITINPRPAAQINALGLNLCSGDSIVLTTQNESSNRYRWQRNTSMLTDTTNRLVVKQPGTYQAVVTAPTGCTAQSNSVVLTEYPKPTAQLDSIMPVCNTNGVPLVLRGQPAGGLYSGPGVRNDQFDPAVAGAGKHKLTYTVTSDKGCKGEQSRWAVVSPGPKLSGKTTYAIAKGDTVQLQIQANEPITQYTWEPPTSLNRVDVASPVANPTETTSYALTAVSAIGCIGTYSVVVEVVEPLYIPSAFSPNADGVNDAWIIPNIASFPQCEVTIYNRWGELIFFSRGYENPWDGTYHQERVSTGVYTYQIRTGLGALSTTYRGQLTVVH
jgi:gliding motility-associated-like protein